MMIRQYFESSANVLSEKEKILIKIIFPSDLNICILPVTW